MARSTLRLSTRALLALALLACGGESPSTSGPVINPPPSGNLIVVNPATTYQTMTGWQGASQIGQLECNATAFANYKGALVDRLVNELGINRVTIALQSGMENTVDYFSPYLANPQDNAAYLAWKQHWFLPVNDNADPLVADPSKFHWSSLDFSIDKVVLPLRQALAARGEKLYVTLTYVDFGNSGTKPFQLMLNSSEYAELVTMAFQHIKSKYGWSPDAFELILEPDNTPYRGADIGRAVVAAGDRLKASGFTPEFLGPSNTAMAGAVSYYDAARQIPRASEYLTTLAYHRYSAVSDDALRQIAQRGERDNVRTMMLEHINSGYEDLWNDVTVGNNSAWMQFALAYCGSTTNPNDGSVYYQINQSDPGNPVVTLTNHAKFFRQMFAYVRGGAVRLAAQSNNAGAVDAAAFRNTNGKFVVVVKTSAGATFSVQGLPAGSYGITYTTASAAHVALPNASVAAGGYIQTSIPDKGLLTIFAR